MRAYFLLDNTDVRRSRLKRTGPYALVAILVTGCSADDQLRQHGDKIRSLRATTIAVADAWLHGDISGTYAHTALEQTFQLVEQERAAVAPTAEDLARPAANALVRTGEQLSREVTALARDVRAGDGAGARRHLGDLETTTPERP